MSDTKTAPTQIAFSITGAAAAIGRDSITAIKVALAAGELIAHYPDSHPIILHKDLLAWAEGLPVDKP
jgi:hypothetical protein